jgi:hypothetical protein
MIPIRINFDVHYLLRGDLRLKGLSGLMGDLRKKSRKTADFQPTHTADAIAHQRTGRGQCITRVAADKTVRPMKGSMTGCRTLMLPSKSELIYACTAPIPVKLRVDMHR